MPRRSSSGSTRGEMPPALNPDAREAQLCALAIDRAEQQLRDGTASAQVITHYLKLASSRERLEREILQGQANLYNAKSKALANSQDERELLERAMRAFTDYSPDGNV